MNEIPICPRSGNECTYTELCSEANEPLIRAIPRIRREVSVAWSLARRYLEHELASQAARRGADFHVTFDHDGSAYVCPADLIEDGLPKRVGAEGTQAALRSLSNVCIEHTIQDLKDRQR